MPLTEDLAADLSRERYALSSLLEFARTLTPDIGPDGIVRSVVRTVMGKSLIKDAFAYLTSENAEYRLVTRSGFAGIALTETIDLTGLDALIADTSHPFTIVPLVSADGAGYLGVLGFGQSINPQFRTDSEATYLASLAALTSIALTNAWLFEREKERERFESELRVAREIQLSLLPQSLPEIEGVEFAAVSRPSEWVGGDYYDVIALGHERFLLCIADVVGKGIGAALTMSNMQAALRALAALLRRGHLSLVEVVKELNRLMTESTAPERFITAAFALFDARHRTIESVVCGHPNPAIAGETTQIMETTGIPLGIIGTFAYESRRYEVPQGSLVFFYTDGLSEARYHGELIGAKGVEEGLLRPELRTGDLKWALERLVVSPNMTIEDDITVLALRLRAA